MSDEKLKRYLMCGADAQQTENILELFARLKGRPATAEERAELATRKLLPGKNGITNLRPLGTGFGFGGVTTKEPKKPG